MITPQGTVSGYDSNRIYETPESKLWRSVYIEVLKSKINSRGELAAEMANRAVEHYRIGIVE